MKQLILIIFISILCACRQDNKPVGFEKIYFHTSSCFGTCPTYHLEVDSNGQVKLIAVEVFKGWGFITAPLDSAKMGYFTGTVNDTTFNKLKHEIQTIGIDTLKFDGGGCCDGSMITILVYYDGKQKRLESRLSFAKANNLIMALYEICEQSNLKRSDQKFAIEGTKE